MAPYTQNYMERIDNTIENLQRQNILKVWNNYTIEDAIILTEKSTKVIKRKTITSCQRKLCPDVVHDFPEFTVKLIKEIMKETVDMAKVRERMKTFKTLILDSRANRHHTRGINTRQLDRDDCC